MKLSRKMWPMIILKVTNTQGFILSLEDTIFKNPQGGRWGQTKPPSLAFLGLNICNYADDNISFAFVKNFSEVTRKLQHNFLTLDQLVTKKCHLITLGISCMFPSFKCNNIPIKNIVSEKLICAIIDNKFASNS